MFFGSRELGIFIIGICLFCNFLERVRFFRWNYFDRFFWNVSWEEVLRIFIFYVDEFVRDGEDLGRITII